MKRSPLSFTSGGSTWIPIFCASATSTGSLSVLPISDDSIAAMNSTRKFAFKYAVWNVTIPYAPECDLLNPYAANSEIWSKICPAFAAVQLFFFTQPSTNAWRCLAISSGFFLPIARRRMSPCPMLKPASTPAACCTCSW